MRYAVLSDVHSNLEAFEAVLADINRRNIRDILFLGDAVGYGPDPNECIDLLTASCGAPIAGNHDWGAIGLMDVAFFNEYARSAIEWTSGVMTKKNKDVLRTFPLKVEYEDKDALAVHATPKEPGAWHYLFSLLDADTNFEYFDNKLCFLGHSHKPFIIEKQLSGGLMTYKDNTRIKKRSRYIINAGSVGQPRDGDPRACYVLVNGGEVNMIRIPYDIESVQNKMRKAHLPSALIERLSRGM